MITLDIVRFCAIECELQESGERSVWWMLDAWEAARAFTPPLVHDNILDLGWRVEPIKNRVGYRHHDVEVAGDVKAEHLFVPSLMIVLLDEQAQESPESWFRRYEDIHPFADGNGRTGVILFNWLQNTLDDPDWPPNFWNDERRMPGYGAPFRA